MQTRTNRLKEHAKHWNISGTDFQPVWAARDPAP